MVLASELANIKKKNNKANFAAVILKHKFEIHIILR